MLDDGEKEQQVGTRVWILAFLLTGCAISRSELMPLWPSVALNGGSISPACGYSEDPGGVSQTPKHFGVERTLTYLMQIVCSDIF